MDHRTALDSVEPSYRGLPPSKEQLFAAGPFVRIRLLPRLRLCWSQRCEVKVGTQLRGRLGLHCGEVPSAHICAHHHHHASNELNGHGQSRLRAGCQSEVSDGAAGAFDQVRLGMREWSGFAR